MEGILSLSGWILGLSLSQLEVLLYKTDCICTSAYVVWCVWWELGTAGEKLRALPHIGRYFSTVIEMQFRLRFHKDDLSGKMRRHCYAIVDENIPAK